MGFIASLKGMVGQQPTAPAPVASPLPTIRKKVLIVEDEKMISDALLEVFRNEGLDMLTAENGQVGLEMVISQKPDIILLDLMMPVMDGKTMLHKVREIPEFKNLPVIVLSNAGDSESIHETKFYDNANEFLIKSNINMGDLVQTVKMHLGVQ